MHKVRKVNKGREGKGGALEKDEDGRRNKRGKVCERGTVASELYMGLTHFKHHFKIS